MVFVKFAFRLIESNNPSLAISEVSTSNDRHVHLEFFANMMMSSLRFRTPGRPSRLPRIILWNFFGGAANTENKSFIPT